MESKCRRIILRMSLLEALEVQLLSLVELRCLLLPWEPRGASGSAELDVLARAWCQRLCGSCSCTHCSISQANAVAGVFSTCLTGTDSAAKLWLLQLLQMGVIPVYLWVRDKSICPGNVIPGSQDFKLEGIQTRACDFQRNLHSPRRISTFYSVISRYKGICKPHSGFCPPRWFMEEGM